jgi:hypothetical protein
MRPSLTRRFFEERLPLPTTRLPVPAADYFNPCLSQTALTGVLPNDKRRAAATRPGNGTATNVAERQ